ncbi:protein TolQ [Pseudomonas sp. TUM22785]|uniref:protein TolQ n=1 Tax=Pseudomonas sp. TUM22785 TaxID=3019098 RepID=UPI0023058866|nr:protein TolQ [Pseudomonas sp. TUM22785]WCD80992.1 protein TolQ [Pseudomonas sp. TUM22785]
MHATLEQMTVWGLISDASLLVKGVMAILLFASLFSWYLIVQRGALLARIERQAKAFQARFRGTADLTQLQRRDEADEDAALERIFHAGYQEFAQLRREPGIAPEMVVDGVERALYVAIAEQEERLEKGLTFLATVGSVSPYIGLFGTVWGIMNSFIGLSQVQQATLSTVAPGIAEALIATAIGLFAAIPAVIAYNRFSARAQGLVARYYAFGNELQGRLQRRLAGANPVAAAA